MACGSMQSHPAFFEPSSRANCGSRKACSPGARPIRRLASSARCAISSAQRSFWPRLPAVSSPDRSCAWTAAALPASPGRSNCDAGAMTNSCRVKLSFAAGCLLCCPLAFAEVSCPDRLEVQPRAAPPAGWSATYGEETPRLINVAIFDGPPANRASVKYNYRRQIGRELHLIWNLVYSPRSYYLQCQYERTNALINSPLPAGT